MTVALYPMLPCAGCGRDTEHGYMGTDVRDRRRAVYGCRVCGSTRVQAAVEEPSEAPPRDVFDEVLGAVEAAQGEPEPCNCEQALALKQRAESAELGCEIAYRREPTQAEGDAHEHVLRDGHGQETRSGECFVPMGGWTGRRCRVCARWVWRGPTTCLMCAECSGLAVRVKELEQRIEVAAEALGWRKP